MRRGTLVRHRDSGEVGVILCTWRDNDGYEDSYVAFFGTELPDEQQKPEKPYVLRYMLASLEPVSPKDER